MGWILKLTFPFLLSKIYHLTYVAGTTAEVLEEILVKIDDVREDEWIKIHAVQLFMMDPWIGLYKYDGYWRWVVDFQVPSFFGWSVHEPNEDGNCSQLSNVLLYNWNDISCDTKYNYICENPASNEEKYCRSNITCAGNSTVAASNNEIGCAMNCLRTTGCCAFMFNIKDLKCELFVMSGKTQADKMKEMSITKC